jgi:hypothetical protein
MPPSTLAAMPLAVLLVPPRTLAATPLALLFPPPRTTASELPIRLESSPSPALLERASQYEAYE